MLVQQPAIHHAHFIAQQEYYEKSILLGTTRAAQLCVEERTNPGEPGTAARECGARSTKERSLARAASFNYYAKNSTKMLRNSLTQRIFV
jgi:hypothetical protein